MKKILIFLIVLNSLLFAAQSDTKKDRVEKQIEIEMEKEKKYSREQIFYSKDNYDFKGAEINPDSLDTLPDIVEDDFDMDSVYD